VYPQSVTYRVVGIRNDGTLETISTSNTLEMAERVCKLIRPDGSRFTEVRIQSSHRKRGRPPKDAYRGGPNGNGAR
jgi:hypothetical protein